MNQILILSPRWHDKVVLLAERRLLTHNEVVINHHEFPEPLYISGERAREFPLEQMKTKAGGYIGVRAVPLDELTQERIMA